MNPVDYFRIPHLTRRVLKVWRRNGLVFLKTFKVNFLPPVLEPILYLLALGFGLGTFITEINGISYAQFIAPALISISIMYSAFFETTYSSFVRMYFQKTFDAIIATPLTIEEVITGEILWGATRSTINAAIMLPILALFGVLAFPSSLLIIPFAFLGGFLFATIGMVFTALTPHIDTLNLPTFLFITPMFLFSGTFFPITLLPEVAQFIAYAILPLTNVVTIARALTLGVLSSSLLYNLVWILAVSALLFLISVNLMRRRLIV
ncbi:MAG TPA: ABC transporter permease [Methanomicrobiales archaeon]|nr:ABC transporter permease [Methanomicrobiales archaeon]